MATRKISDLTLLTTVSPSDTLLLLDNSDPVDTNKKSQVSSIFKAVAGGTQNQPGLAFDQKTSTGLYSEAQNQLGLALGDSKLLLEKQSTSLVVAARDSADANLDLTLQALGTGVIRFGSDIAITDTVFSIPNSSDNTKIAKFSSTQIPTGETRTYVLPDPGVSADTLVTLNSTQTLANKTLDAPVFTGTLTATSMNLSGNIQVDNNTTLGSSNIDTVTVAATSTFNANTTFNGTITSNALATHTNEVQINQTSGSGLYNKIKWWDTAQNTNAGNWAADLEVTSDASTRYLDLKYYDTDTGYTSTNYTYGLRVASIGYTLPEATLTVNGGVIDGYNITNAGKFLSGTVTPVLSGDGSNAVITPVITNGQLTALTISNGGSGYTTATITFTTSGGSLQYRTYDNSGEVETKETVIHTGNLNLISAIGSVNNFVATGSVNFDDGTFVLDDTNDRVGIGRTPATHKLEVGGDIYFTGPQFIGGDSSSFTIQKRQGAVPILFKNQGGSTEVQIDGSGRFGIAKSPAKNLDVLGDSNIDGDLYLTETDTINNIGGALHCKRLKLTDLNGAVQTITADDISATSRNKVYFHAYS